MSGLREGMHEIPAGRSCSHDHHRGPLIGIAWGTMDAVDRMGEQAGDIVSRHPLAEQRRCILVLGMHRSGTSALTRVLNLMGAAVPADVISADAHNKAGYWEPSRLNALHEKMLAEAGSRWDDWRAFNFDNLAGPRRRFYRSEILKLLEQEYGRAPLFVLKEPRICRFVPLYADILASVGVDTRYLLPLRNPLAVAASLTKRDGFTPHFGTLLWLRHELDAECATRGKPRVFVSYDGMLEDWRPGSRGSRRGCHSPGPDPARRRPTRSMRISQKSIRIMWLMMTSSMQIPALQDW